MSEKVFRQLMLAYQSIYFQLIHAAYATIDLTTISFAAASESNEENLKWLSEIPTYGLYVGNKLCSVVSLRFPWGKHPGPSKYPHLGRLATHPDFKGKGYAKEIFALLEKNILQETLQSPYVTLGTALSHEWLVSMYLHWGFKPLQRKKLPGNIHETLYMKKTVGAEREDTA